MAYAEANLRKGNRLEAMKTYQKLEKLKPENTDVKVALVKIYYSMDHHRDALQEIKDILKIEPRHIESHLLLRRIDRKFGIPQDMRRDFEEHLTFTASPRKIRVLKKQYELEKRKYEKLIADYDRQMEEDQDNPILLYNKSKAEERVKLAEETLEDLEEMKGEEVEEEEAYPSAEVEAPTLLTLEPVEELPTEKAESEEEEVVEEITSEEPIPEATQEETELEVSSIEPKPLEEMEEAIVEVREEEEEAEHGAVEKSAADEEEEEAVAAPSARRIEFYQGLTGQLDEILNAINRTRGVTSSMVIDNTGYVIHNISSDTFDPSQVSNQLLEGVRALISWKADEGEHARQLLYWVLEFKKGLMVLHPLAPEIYLVVMGHRRANFGAVKYSIEKNTADIKQTFEEMPE